MTLEKKYQKKTQLEHILTRPDTYVGDIKLQTEKLYIHRDGKIVKEEIDYIPALYKIFDEILVNASDHSKNDKTCKNIKITIAPDEISVYNDGNGIDVEIHQEYKIYVPELVFGELLTSTNYDDTEKRVTGGRNGYGAKLTNIFSTFFSVETIDSKRKRKFYQEYSDNMSSRTKPVITELKTNITSYTKILFKPDFEKFGIVELTDNIISLFEKRVYDLAGTLEGVKVYLNNVLIPINSFQDYIQLYFDPEQEIEIFAEKNARWDIGFVYRPDGGFEHISHVNNICTYHGGSHVDYINDQIINYIQKQIEKKNKDAINKIKSHSIKDHYMIFINCTIENPAFTSQTKETLKTKQNEFGSTCELSEKILKKINSSGILNVLLDYLKFKEESLLMKKTDGKKVNAIKGIPKLEDAEWAGTKKSKMCKLILTEGDSAKALAMSGRSVVGNQKYGIFPLKGKLLNVRGASPKELLNNEEIINLKKILGLKHGKVYVNSGKEAKEVKEDEKTEKDDSKSKICDISELRYGGIVSLCDQDVDGYHIKGLLINFFAYFWPSLLKIDGFFDSLPTPIIKATKGKQAKIFYNLTDYDDWKKTIDNGWHIKYYKGLGTSTREEGKEYFTDFDGNLIHYLWRPQPGSNNDDEEQNNSEESEELVGEIDHPCHQAIMLAFDKKKADNRKSWLMNYDPNLILTPDIKQVPFNDFVNKELIHFSNEDIKRSIPSLIDGLKPSQRKILFGTILRKLFTKNSEIKVSQLTGYISDKTCYHHGEQSLNMAIVNMAQRFMGSNNVNILMPSGQFGTRLTGKDAASPRYIFTYLNPIIRMIYREEDDPILKYLEDDGTPIEPDYYLPILPMILINGAEGIGTGFSTQVLPYNPLDLIENIKCMMEDKPLKELRPYYQGFKGKISQEDKTYSFQGNYECISGDLIITELPPGVWTSVYKEFLNDLEEKKEISKFTNNNTDEDVYFKITLDGNKSDHLSEKELVQKFKLNKKISISNMHLYDKDNRIKKYGNVNDILREFYQVRLDAYTTRKNYYLDKYQKELDALKYKMKFIEDVLEDKIVINRKKRDEIVEQLVRKKYPQQNNDKYEYLLSMPIHSFTYEKIEDMKDKITNKEEEINLLESKTEKELWVDELEEFRAAYVKEYSPVATNVKVVKTIVKTVASPKKTVPKAKK
jgi:DNA topoisomerase-2